MRRNPHSFLWDVCDAANAIADFIRGRDFHHYMGDRIDDASVWRVVAEEQQAAALLAELGDAP